MDNQEYVKMLGVDRDAQDHCLAVMEKYGDNHWWEESADPRAFAYHQIKEPVMLTDFGRFHNATESLLGRPVYVHEFGLHPEKLEEEAEWAMNGADSEEDRAKRAAEAINDLVEYCSENSKPIILIDLQEA